MDNLEDLQRLRALVKERSGIWVSDGRMRSFHSRLANRMKATSAETARDYFYFIKYDPNGAEEMDSLIEEVTVNETYFFREKEQLDDFLTEVAPQLLHKKNGTEPLTVWSAGCSTGEEPYTLAMLLLEHPCGIRPSRINILASDIDRKALHQAREGIYDKYSLRCLPPSYMTKYFIEVENGKYAIGEEAKQVVRFARANLMDALATHRLRDLDCIFCRNVLIYFDDEDKVKCLGHLYQSLGKGGYLFPGHSENPTRISDLFEVVRLKQTVVYRKSE